MSRIQVTWAVKMKSGQIKGPYPTEAIIRMIADGVFMGDEMISRLPDGQWTLISKEPDFYDKLLDALEVVVQIDPKQAQRMNAETFVKQEEKLPQAPKPIESTKLTIEPSKHKVDIYDTPSFVPPPLSIPQNSAQDSVIDLANIANIEKSAIRKSIKGPVIGFIFIITAVVLFLWEPSSQGHDKIHLLEPKKSTGTLSDQHVRQALNEALIALEQDSFEGYVTAQNKIVTIIEGAPLNIEVRGLLCLVYKQLWPFSYQDAQDIKAMASATQAARAINIVSPFGQVCEAIKLMTSGRLKEAKGVVDATLDANEPFSLIPVLYSLKGELLDGEKDYLNAGPYLEKAIQLWDKWLYPQVVLARMYFIQGEYTSSAGVLKKILNKNPRHRIAKILIGLVEFRGFKNNESAFVNLSTAMQSKDRVPSLIESEGWAALSEIYMSRGEKDQALEAAKKGYEKNPNNNELRQLVVRLGGSDKVKSEKGKNQELLYLGDQYVRQGDYLAAQAEFKAAFDIDPKNGMAAMKAAKALWQLNQSFEAIEWLKKAIKAEPKLVSAYVLQADYLSQKYDFFGATQLLSNAIKISSNNYEVLRGFSSLEYRKNNMPGAITYGLRAMKAFDGDVETYILLSKANGQLAKSIVPVNNKEIEKKEAAAKDAIRYATKAVEIDATNPEAQINYAKMLAQTNGVDSGISYLNELIKKFAYTTDYRVALAEVLKSEERYSQARDAYEKVIEADPKNKKALLGLGDCYRAMGLESKALNSFLNAAVLDPSDGEALFQAGRWYFDKNDYHKAIEQFKRVQKLNPNFPKVFYYIGKAAFSSGDFANALEATKAEKKLNPNLADSYILAAEVYTANRQFSECAAEYSHAIKLRPQGADIYVKSATCYRQSGSYEVAQDMLSLAMDRENGYAEIYREQGALYELKGDSRSAAQSYTKYLDLAPNAPDRGDVEGRIRRLGF
jgi:tetratricopeptide (TPR) repeat protein